MPLASNLARYVSSNDTIELKIADAVTRAKAQGGKDMSSGGFAARAQAGAANNANAAAQQGKGQAPSGKN
jgi:hypothetical protein